MRNKSEIRNPKSEASVTERGQLCPRVFRFKSEIRNPRSERNPKPEYRRRCGTALIANHFCARCREVFFGFRISDFFRISGTRISDFAFNFFFAFFATTLLLVPSSSRAAFVSETATEFFTSGYFNNDTNADVLVLDKVTGIGRVGYQDGTGALTWSAPLLTGVENVTGCAVGKFLQSTRDNLAVTSTDYNRVPLVDLSNTNSASTPFIVTPLGIGAHTLVGMVQPSSSLDALFVASAFNSPPAERIELINFFPGPLTSTFGPFNETGLFERGNALQVTTNGPTFAVGLVRGETNDTLHLWQFTNAPSVIATLSNLPPGSDYVFGKFDGQILPHFWFYVSGQSNVTIRPLISSGGGYNFGAAISLNFTQAVQNIYYVAQGNDGSAFIRFGDGIQGARLPGGSPQLAPKYRGGGGASGNVFSGIAELDNGRFALFSAPTGGVSSVRAQVMTFDGTTYTQISSNNLPSLTTRNTRATVWLFQSEPFITSAATLISSLTVPDWSSGVFGLPGSLSVRAENDAGASSGLGSPATNNLGAPPSGTTYALPDQYRDDISFFSYAPPRPAEPVVITISPAPGNYGGPIQISFTKQNVAHQVFYQVGNADTYHLYSAPFTLTNDTTINYYGNVPGGSRGRLQFASYTVGHTNIPLTPPVKLPGSDTNPPPNLNTNFVQLSANGTLFYSRHTALAESENFQGPSPYLSLADSPFNAAGFNYFYLEDFEDGAFNTPGATPSAGWVVVGPGGVDSVEPGGRSYYSGGSQTNLTITFNAAALGGKLPTHAGIVWTDVGSVNPGTFGFGNVRFTARDANGVSLGTNFGNNLGNGSGIPSSAEDRFFGIVNPGGISSISISMPNSGDWEVDHLQYGFLDSAGFNDSIWAINLDGTGEKFVTEGARPRVSRDGQWMAFLREGGSVTTRGNLWLRNLQTGAETRFFTNTDSIVGFDWNGNAELIFDNNCGLFRKPLNGPATPLPLAITPECLNGAPVVNPLNARLAFQNLSPNAAGVYVTPPDWSSRTRVNEPATLRLRWPGWSFDGARLAMADRVSSAFINTGVNLWTAAADGSNLHQITVLTEPTGGFPHGAIWTPDGRALVGAGRIYGTNGLWIIPLSEDGFTCSGSPRLLLTSAGSEIDFAGSIRVAPPAPIGVMPGLFVRQEPNAVVVYWSTNFAGYTLESQMNLSPLGAWTPITGPYFLAGGYYEYREARANLAAGKFFRLRLTGVIILTPSEPDLSFRFESNQVVLNWPSSYASYTLEVTTNLSPPVMWSQVTGTYQTNGVVEFRRNLPGPPQEFYRLRWP